jgi:hypothetical protein
LTPANLLLPVFIHDGDDDIPIDSMPGVSRLGWKTGLLRAVREARAEGVNSVVLFPKVRGFPCSLSLFSWKRKRQKRKKRKASSFLLYWACF